MIVVNVSSELANGERRVDPSWTFEELRKKLEPVTGIPPEVQELKFYSPTNLHKQVTKETTLGELGVSDGWLVRVIDPRPESEREFVPDEDVKSYEISQSEYEKRPNTVLAYLRENKLGRFSDKPPAKSSESIEQTEAVNTQNSDEEEL